MLNKEKPEPQPQKTEALVKQNALPALEVVKNRDGSDRLAARQKGRFTKTANARVLATQKSIEKILHLPNDSGKTQLERIITTQAKVAEENTDARNLGAVTKFIEITDEISGTKAAREALTKEINTPIVPTVIMIPMLNVPFAEPQKPSPTQPSWVRNEPKIAEVMSITTNSVSAEPNPWSGARDRRHNKPVVLTNDRREAHQ
jgi:hypothetical protein